MKKVKFSTRIEAPAQKVWDVLWQDKSYRQWTAAFTPGSYAESDWKEGSKVKFLSPEGEGMYSEIARKVPNEFMSFRHLGMIKDGKVITDAPEMAEWKGALENYRLKANGGVTELEVELDTAEEHEKHFGDMFPKALQKVKELAEG